MATDEEVLSGSEPGSAGTAVFVIPIPDGMAATDFAARLREAVPDLAAGGALALDLAGQSEFGSLIGREGRTVRVEVSAPQRGDAARAAEQVRIALEDVPQLADVRDAFAGTQPLVELTLNRERIAQRGLHAAGDHQRPQGFARWRGGNGAARDRSPHSHSGALRWHRQRGSHHRARCPRAGHAVRASSSTSPKHVHRSKWSG